MALTLLGPEQKEDLGNDGGTGIEASLVSNIKWVTGTDTGVGESGATVIHTGRREGPWEDVARYINQDGIAHVQPMILARAAEI